MNGFWYLLSGLAFVVAGWYFIKVIMRPSNTTKHLFEISVGYLSFMLTGLVFFGLLVAAILR